MSFKTLEENILGLSQDVMSNYEATYTHIVGGLQDVIKIIFDRDYLDVQGTGSVHPVALVNLSDLSSEPGKGDTIEIDSVTYRVLRPEPDGIGGAVLILQET